MQERGIGIVVIGRNEGDRLLESLDSALREEVPVVYVDSASTDGSVDRVRAQRPSVHVVVLDDRRRQTAARARNAGMARLLAEHPDTEIVQFLDGDCCLCPEWISTGAAYLREHPEVGVIAGRLLEERRDRNVFHRVAALEWTVPPGPTDTVGGPAMVRVEAFVAADGQDAGVPAGEELEFCLRVAQQGFGLVRMADDMARHDIDMDRLAQWWRRQVRLGHAYAQGVYIHRNPEHVRRLASIGLWGLAVPTVALGASVPTLGLSLGLFLGYPRTWWKVRQHRRQAGESPTDASVWATSVVLGKFACVLGVRDFVTKTLPAQRGRARAGLSVIAEEVGAPLAEAR